MIWINLMFRIRNERTAHCRVSARWIPKDWLPKKVQLESVRRGTLPTVKEFNMHFLGNWVVIQWFTVSFSCSIWIGTTTGTQAHVIHTVQVVLVAEAMERLSEGASTLSSCWAVDFFLGRSDAWTWKHQSCYYIYICISYVYKWYIYICIYIVCIYTYDIV